MYITYFSMITYLYLYLLSILYLSKICKLRLSQHSVVNWVVGAIETAEDGSSSLLFLQLNLTRQIGFYILQVARDMWGPQ